MLNNITNNILYDKIGYFIYVTKVTNSTKVTNPDNCCWDLANKTIAYTSISDYYFISSIVRGYRIDASTVNLIRILPTDLLKEDVKFDILITYIIPDSNYIDILNKTNLIISGFTDMDINRIKAFYPFVNEEYTDLDIIFNNKLKSVTIINNKSLTPSMNYIILKDIPILSYEYIRTKDRIKENFITRVELSKDAYDPSYFCNGDKDTNNKFQCNSPYDVDNTLKKNYTFWDKMCTKNEDCPYYDKYKNKGGCNSGYCDFPVGIKRIGFTNYNDKGIHTPFCYGCDHLDVNCCNNQDVPDYVYPNDFTERSLNHKETVVSKFDYVV